MVNVIGLGYIGLPTALMLAAHGVEVVGTDYNEELVETLNAGRTTFKEDGLDSLFARAVEAGIRLHHRIPAVRRLHRERAHALRQGIEEDRCRLRCGGSGKRAGCCALGRRRGGGVNGVARHHRPLRAPCR